MKSIAFQMFLGIFIYLAVVSAQNGSALTCQPYIPFGPNYDEPTGNVEFSGNGVDVFGYPNNPMITQGNYYSAWTFFARSCNSSSLGLYGSWDNPAGCDPNKSADCEITRLDYIQILNTVTGHCMTWERYDEASDITFTPCNHAPTTAAQLFTARSVNDYSNRASLSLTSKGEDFTFIISSDGKTPRIDTYDTDGTIVNGTYIPTTRK